MTFYSDPATCRDIIYHLVLFIVTLHDIVHTDKSLTLVFEYLERDLKQYMDDCGAILAINNVKLFLFQVHAATIVIFYLK